MTMSGFRKTIAVFIIAFIGIPTLMGIIWGVGVTRAVVSPEFLSDLPRDIIAKVPSMIDETLEAVEREDAVDDEEARVWIKAIAEIDTSPKELLEEIGVMSWLENELSQSLEDIGKIMRGEISPRPVTLNLRPLKKALKHEAIDQYLKDVLQQLPTCSDEQMQEWLDIADKDFHRDLPPCRPQGLENAITLLRSHWHREVDKEIVSEVNIFDVRWDDHMHFDYDFGVGIMKIVVAATFFLFLIPLTFFVLAGLIGSGWNAGVLRWIGGSAVAGGGITYLLSKFAGEVLQFGVSAFPFHYDYPYQDVRVAEIFFEKAGDIGIVVANHLFSAVYSVSGIVVIVGIVLIALSYAFVSEKRGSGGTRAQRATAASPQPPAPPSPQAPPAPTVEEPVAKREPWEKDE